MYRNRFDRTGQCSEDGKKAEDLFAKLASQREFLVRDATEQEQFDHIDYVMQKHNQKTTVDVKARKKLSRSSTEYNDNMVWVEWKNVRGKNGWLHGKADLIAFEQESHYLIMSRNQLAMLCEKLVDKNIKAEDPRSALNRVYTRQGRKDLVSLVRISDIEENIKTVRWKKNV